MNQTKLIKIENFYLKREDQNPTGSAKDRALVAQIQNLIEKKITNAVISSTGNAAISAAYFCQKQGINLTIFVSPKINLKKLSLISPSAKIITSLKPISDSFKFSKSQNAYFLRQSTDPSSLIGYQEIAKEILNQNPQTTSIFIPVGSGTTLLGISQKLPPHIPIFAIQSAANPTITSKFNSQYTKETQLITDALSAKYLPLKSKILNAIKKSKGTGLTIQNQQIINSHQHLLDLNVRCSLEGGLTLAGFELANKLSLNIGNNPIILITGTLR